MCPTGTNCTFSPDLEVRIIKGGASCGCGEQVLTIETHGFYKACYCLTAPGLGFSPERCEAR